MDRAPRDGMQGAGRTVDDDASDPLVLLHITQCGVVQSAEPGTSYGLAVSRPCCTHVWRRTPAYRAARLDQQIRLWVLHFPLKALNERLDLGVLLLAPLEKRCSLVLRFTPAPREWTASARAPENVARRCAASRADRGQRTMNVSLL